MATFTPTTGTPIAADITAADLRYQSGRSSATILGATKLVSVPGTQRGLAGTLEVMTTTWATARALMNLFSAPFTITETALGFTSAAFAPTGEPVAQAITGAGRAAYWTIRIEIAEQ